MPYFRRPPDVGDVASRILRSARPVAPHPSTDSIFSLHGIYSAHPGPGQGSDTAPFDPSQYGGADNQGPYMLNAPGGGGGGDGGFNPDPNAINAQVQGMIDPILQYLTQKYNAQAQGVSNAYGQLTDQYVAANQRYAGQVPGMFSASRKMVSGVTEGVNNQLTDLGQVLNEAQRQSETQAGLAKNSQGSDIKLNKIGRGAAGAATAIGAAEIDALRAAQASAEKYAGQLPGFAKLEGAANTRSVLSQIAGELADQLAQTTAQAPQLYYQIYNDLRDQYNSDRSFNESVREYQQSRSDTLAANAATAAQRRAGIAGPQAPTLAGRQAYWDSVAAQRTSDLGYEWVGTTTGVRPVDDDPTKPGIQYRYTIKGQAAQAAGATPPRPVRTSNGTIVWNPVTQSWDKIPGTAPVRRPPAARTQVVQDSTDGSKVLIDLNTGEVIRQVSGPQPNWHVTKPTTTHGPGYGKVTGTAPRRIRPGVWVTRSGVRLGAAAEAIWERLWREHRTDGHGSWTPPPKPTTSSATHRLH